MRILMLNNEFPPLGGGTGVVNYHLFQELAHYSDISVDLVTSSRTRHEYEEEQFSERIKIYKVPVDNQNIHHSSNIELLRYTMRGLFLCRKLMEKHSYDLSFAFAGVPAGVMSYVLQQIADLPYIVSLQGPDVPGFEARYNYLYPFLKPILRKVWRKAHTVLAISQQHRDLALQTLPDLTIPIIYNGVETDVFTPKQTESQEIRLICVGRLIERKGQHHLLRSFAQLQTQYKDHKLLLTLVGTGDAERELRKLATELNIDDSVTFLGFVPREKMPEIYHHADIFILPSQSEGMSIALLEAMASGLPVVVTDAGGTDELITAGENGIVVRWADVEGLTQGLIQLVNNPSQRENMGIKNRNRAVELSWQHITQDYVDIMKQIQQSKDTGK